MGSIRNRDMMGESYHHHGSNTQYVHLVSNNRQSPLAVVDVSGKARWRNPPSTSSCQIWLKMCS